MVQTSDKIGFGFVFWKASESVQHVSTRHFEISPVIPCRPLFNRSVSSVSPMESAKSFR